MPRKDTNCQEAMQQSLFRWTGRTKPMWTHSKVLKKNYELKTARNNWNLTYRTTVHVSRVQTSGLNRSLQPEHPYPVDFNTEWTCCICVLWLLYCILILSQFLPSAFVHDNYRSICYCRAKAVQCHHRFQNVNESSDCHLLSYSFQNFQ